MSTYVYGHGNERRTLRTENIAQIRYYGQQMVHVVFLNDAYVTLVGDSAAEAETMYAELVQRMKY